MAFASAFRADQGQAAARPGGPGVDQLHRVAIGRRNHEILAAEGFGAIEREPQLTFQWEIQSQIDLPIQTRDRGKHRPTAFAAPLFVNDIG
jgi:hypothetical protein